MFFDFSCLRFPRFKAFSTFLLLFGTKCLMLMFTKVVAKIMITTVLWRCKKYSLWEGQKRKIFFIFKESAAFSFSIFQQMLYCALFLDCALLSTWNYTRWSKFFLFFFFALANFGGFFCYCKHSLRLLHNFLMN